MKPCHNNKIRNPKTNRCVDPNGKIGLMVKKYLVLQQLKKKGMTEKDAVEKIVQAKQGQAKQDKAKQGQAKQDKAKHGQVEQSKVGQAKQSKAKQSQVEQSKVGQAKQSKAKQGQVEQSKVGQAKQSKAKQGHAEQSKAKQSKVVMKKPKKCKDNEILNPLTNRCVKRDGVVGKKIAEGKIIAPSKKGQKEMKRCAPDQIINPQNLKCYKRSSAAGKKLYYQKIKRQGGHYQKYFLTPIPLKSAIDYVKKLVFSEDTLSRRYLEVENYFYHHGPSFPISYLNDSFVKNYFRENKLSLSKTLEENRQTVQTLIKTTKPYSFEHMMKLSVPYVYRIFNTPELFKKNISSHSVTVTPLYRYPYMWLLEQMTYLNQLTTVDKDIIKVYSKEGYRGMNALVANCLKPVSSTFPSDNKKLFQNVFKSVYGEKLGVSDRSDKNVQDTLFRLLVQRLNVVIHNAPPVPYDILLFKGLKNKIDIKRKGFMSTSLDISATNSFSSTSCCRYYFIVKKNTPALAILFLAKHNEKEILLPYDLKYNLVANNVTNMNASVQKKFKKIDVYEIEKR